MTFSSCMIRESRVTFDAKKIRPYTSYTSYTSVLHLIGSDIVIQSEVFAVQAVRDVCSWQVEGEEECQKDVANMDSAVSWQS